MSFERDLIQFINNGSFRELTKQQVPEYFEGFNTCFQEEFERELALVNVLKNRFSLTDLQTRDRFLIYNAFLSFKNFCKIKEIINKK